MSPTAKAAPTKDFFVRMITRDISLEDCILDLLDNCVDGAGRQLENKNPESRSLDGFEANIEISSELFRISDNCGGITLDDAVNYAFRFGRRSDAPTDAGYGIGLYGIGMKRALFKMGNLIEVRSKTVDDGFLVPINVLEWSNKAEWDFDLEPDSDTTEIGTEITIRDIHESIAEEFGDSVFENKLRKIIARDYSFIIQDGFKIRLNRKIVNAHEYKLKASDDFAPIKLNYIDNGVEVRVIAGLAGLLPEDISPDLIDQKNVEYFGWFVACNDRIVVAGSKSDDTVWGNEGFQKWHPQYNGFMGIVRFDSSDPSLLPWTTTKRDIEPQSGVYRRALVKMKEATRAFINYSNARKSDLEAAKKKEQSAALVNLSDLAEQNRMRVPVVKINRVRQANILYKVDLDRAKAVAKALGNGNLPYRQIGLQTFDYFYKSEVEE